MTLQISHLGLTKNQEFISSYHHASLPITLSCVLYENFVLEHLNKKLHKFPDRKEMGGVPFEIVWARP